MNTTEQRTEPDSLDVLAWRAFTPEESIAHTKNIAAHARSRDMENPIFRSALVFRRTFSPVDVYCVSVRSCHLASIPVV